MPNVQITDLPAALPLDGSELVPVVQGGITVRTTTGAVSGSPNMQQTFLTVNQEPTLPNSRYFAAASGISITDSGAQGSYRIALTGAAAALDTSGNGFQVKTGIDSVTARSLATSGSGLSVTNGDGVAGNPTFQLTGLAQSIANMSGNGLVALRGSAFTPVSIIGTASQISVSNGNALSGNPTISLINTGVTSGAYGSATTVATFTVDDQGRITLAANAPIAINASQITNGQLSIIRGGTGSSTANGALNNLLPTQAGNTGKVLQTDGIDASWASISGVGTVTEVIAGTGLNVGSGPGGSITSSGTLNLANTAVIPGSYTAPDIVIDAQGRITSAANGAPSTTFSAGTTGFTPNTPSSGNVVLDGVLNVANGGTGTSALNGYVKGNGTSSFTASTTIPSTAITGLGTMSTQNANNISVSGGTINGTTISGATNTITNIANGSLVNSSVTINGNSVSLGGSTTVTATASNALTISTGLTGTSYNGSTPVTIAIDSTVATLTGTQTLTNKTLTDPKILNTIKLTGSGAPAYTPFVQTFSSASTDYNGYQLNYIQNINNGSDASVDYVAYNDASDVNSYFIDMGISSSNFTDPVYTVFPANAGYVYTGGGSSGQASSLLLGTSNAASDIIMFTGDTLLANIRATVKGDTGNVLINTSTDTGYKLNVNGTTYFGGASTFGSTVLLNADPTLALQAATKQYVDSAVSTGFTVHPAVRLATTAALASNVYANGTAGVGATLTASANGALSIDGVAVVVGNRVLIQNEAAASHNGAYTVTATGSGAAKYVLTRATDFDQAAAGEIANNAYFFVNEGSVNAGSSFILSQTAAITVGTTALPFTQFSDQLNYVGGTNINVTGLTISLTGTVAATNGGTGTNTVTTGDLLYGSATDTWSKLPLGIAYKSLVVNASGTQIEWNAVALNQTSAVSGQLNVSNGGTGASTLTGYLVGNGTSAFTASSTIPNTAITGLGTMSTQNANSVAITGGSIDNTVIGASTAVAGTFTTVTATTGISGGTF